MSIMETIRRSTDSTAARVVFGAIVLVFVFWGVGAQGPTSETYAVVNGERITDSAFRRAYQNVTNGQALDDDESRDVSARVLDMLIEERVVLQEARALGLEVSDLEVFAQIAKIPAFQDSDARFSGELYERTLKRMGYSKGRFEESIRESMLAQKLEKVLSVSVQVSEAELKRRYEESATQLAVSWIRITDADMIEYVTVDEAAVQEYRANRQDSIKAAYDKEFNTRWSEPKQATISRIVLKTRLPSGTPVDEAAVREQITAVLEQARNGGDFAALARRWSEDSATVLVGGEVGVQTAVQMGPVVSEAVFAAGAGNITDVLDTARGLEIVSVHSVKDAVVTSMEDASDTIVRELVAQDGVDAFADDLAEKIRVSWTETGAPESGLLEAHGLTLTEAPATSKAEPKLVGATDSPRLIAAVKAATNVGVLEGVYQADDARLVAAVRDYQKADLATWEARKDMFMGIYARGRSEDFGARWRADAVARAHITDRKTFR